MLQAIERILSMTVVDMCSFCVCMCRAFWAQTTAESRLLFTDTSLDHTYKKSPPKVCL